MTEWWTTPSWTASTLFRLLLCLVAVETAGWGPGTPGLAEPPPQFERYGACPMEVHGPIHLVVVLLAGRLPEGVGDLSRATTGADVSRPFVRSSGAFAGAGPDD